MRRKTRTLILALMVAAVAGSTAFVFHCVPFYAPSFPAWIRIAMAATGSASPPFPLYSVHIRTRERALALAVCGVGVAVTAVLWQAPVTGSDRPHQRLDDFLPEYRFHNAHEARVHAPLQVVAKAVRQVSPADMPFAVLLLRVRASAGGALLGGGAGRGRARGSRRTPPRRRLGGGAAAERGRGPSRPAPAWRARRVRQGPGRRRPLPPDLPETTLRDPLVDQA
jgi:hypothetical protein